MPNEFAQMEVAEAALLDVLVGFAAYAANGILAHRACFTSSINPLL